MTLYFKDLPIGFKDLSLKDLIDLTLQAGEIALEYYHKQDLHTHQKTDNTPVSEGDLAVNDFLMKALGVLDGDIGIVSEEVAMAPLKRMGLEWYWLIDPIDGTKAYISQDNGEFTINIALMHKHRPILGIIYAPYHDELYYGVQGQGAYRVKDQLCQRLPLHPSKNVIYSSQAHRYKQGEAFVEAIAQTGIYELAHLSSSLKLGRIASGEGILYARFGPTSEWDIAAGDILITESKKVLLDLQTKVAPAYGKATLRNNNFIAYDPALKIDHLLNNF